MTIGKKIQQLRKTNGMSQEDLASHMSVSRQAVSKWELDEAVPDTNNLVQLCKIFGVSADYLLSEDIESHMDNPATRENGSRFNRQSNRKLWVIVIGAAVIILAIIGIVNNYISTVITGLIFISVIYLIVLIVKALRKYVGH